MRALFAANTPPDPNQGAAGADLATIGALRAQGHVVDEVWEPARPRRLSHGNLHQLLELPRAYERAIDERCRTQAYDVLQANQPHAYRAARRHRALGRPGIFVNRSHGWEPAVREAFTQRGLLPGPDRAAWRRWAAGLMWQALRRHNAWVLRWSDGVVVCSATDLEFIVARHGYPRERLLALTPGVAEEYLASPPGSDVARATRVLYVGQFSSHKAPDTVAQLFTRLCHDQPGIELTWVSRAQDHKRIAALLGESARAGVQLLDWMPRTELKQVFDRHGILLLPSRFEGFSLTLLEGMARGLCVVATDVGGARQAIQHGINGCLRPPEDLAGLTADLVRLCEAPDEVRRLGLAARKAAEQLTWGRAARSLSDFWQQLIELRRGKAR